MTDRERSRFMRGLALVVLLGVSGCSKVAPRETPEEAIAAIRQLGGEVNIDFKTGASLGQLKELRWFCTLMLSDTALTDAGLERVEGLRHLQTLDLRNTKIADAGLAYLHGFEHLNNLHLMGTQVTVEGCKRPKKAFPYFIIDGSFTKYRE
jgi:hypothetical protein